MIEPMEEGFIYLAGPYSHADPKVRAARFQALTQVAARLMNEGHVVHSPITHGHTIHLRHTMPETWDFWRVQSLRMLEQAALMVVVMIPGWEESTGVAAEIEHAEALGIPVVYVEMVIGDQDDDS